MDRGREVGGGRGEGEKELEKHTLNRFTSDLWMIITVHRERLREREEEGDAMM